jgi:hypothetical protein
VALELEFRAFTLSGSAALFVMGIFQIGSGELFAWAGLNHDLPNLCLLSSLDYSCEPLSPAKNVVLNSIYIFVVLGLELRLYSFLYCGIYKGSYNVSNRLYSCLGIYSTTGVIPPAIFYEELRQ